VQPLSSQWGGYLTVFRSAYFWRFAIPAVAFHSGFVAYQSLWMGPWFTRVLGLSSAQTAQALLVFNFVLMVGYMFLGWVAPRLSRAGWSTLRTVAWGTAVTLVAQLAIVFAQGAAAWLLWLCLALGVTTYTLVQTHVSLTFPGELTGRAFSAFNLMLFVGMFAIQWLFGVLIDTLAAVPAIGEGPPAFRAALFLWVLLQLAAFAVMLGWRVQPATDPASGR
jgi:MFS family permease